MLSQIKLIIYTHVHRPILTNRQMRGEDLHGLTIEELQHLETMLEQGLSRVHQTKVSISCFLCEACVHC